MPTTIAIPSLAGSAGKTTTTVTLAGLLAESGYRVRVIDADPQANATFHLGVETQGVKGLCEVLLREASIGDAEHLTAVKGLTVVAASEALNTTALELQRNVYGAEQRLARAMRDAPPVDVTIIDCPGVQGLLPVSALVAATSVLTVTLPTLKEMAGIDPVAQIVADVREAYNPGMELVAVVPCAVPRNGGRVYEAAIELLRATYGDLVTPDVRRSARVVEAYSHQVPLHLHAPNEPVTSDYRQVLDRLISDGVVPDRPAALN